MAAEVDARVQRTGRHSCIYLAIYPHSQYTRCANEFVISSTWPCMRPMILWDACSAKIAAGVYVTPGTEGIDSDSIIDTRGQVVCADL